MDIQEAWYGPEQRPMNPGDHIRAVLATGEVRTGMAKDLYAMGDIPVCYQLIEIDPFIGRQNMEQKQKAPATLLPAQTPESPPSPAPAKPRRYTVKMTSVDTLTWETSTWIESCRWRWVALLHVWLSKFPSGGQYRITAEIVDDLS